MPRGPLFTSVGSLATQIGFRNTGPAVAGHFGTSWWAACVSAGETEGCSAGGVVWALMGLGARQ